MDTGVRESRPMVIDPWSKYDQSLQNKPLIQSATGGEPGARLKADGGVKTEQVERRSPPDSDKTKTLINEVQSYVEDLNIQLDFSFQDNTGDLIVKVLDRDTGDVIRQIPPDDLVQLREKLKELRGVLFDGKL